MNWEGMAVAKHLVLQLQAMEHLREGAGEPAAARQGGSGSALGGHAAAA